MTQLTMTTETTERQRAYVEAQRAKGHGLGVVAGGDEVLRPGRPLSTGQGAADGQVKGRGLSLQGRELHVVPGLERRLLPHEALVGGGQLAEHGVEDGQRAGDVQPAQAEGQGAPRGGGACERGVHKDRGQRGKGAS